MEWKGIYSRGVEIQCERQINICRREQGGDDINSQLDLSWLDTALLDSTQTYQEVKFCQE